MTDEAFFTVLDDADDVLRVRANQPAVGPWDPGALHAGPPTALAANALRRHHPPAERMTTRLGVEVLRPVPKADLVVTAHVPRPGRKVEMLRAEVAGPDGAPCLLLTEWRIRRAPLDLGAGREGEVLPDPSQGRASAGFFRPVTHEGYVQAMEVRFLAGDWGDPGPATAWMRMRVPLLAGEEPDGLDRLLVAADSGNGISARFDGIFVNVDLTVHLVHEPQGEWIGLDARTVLTDHGVGLATSTLHDRSGPVGRGAQSLLLDRQA